jgi:hypothetical protein
MVIEGFDDIPLVILGADGENDAASRQLSGVVLDRGKGFTKAISLPQDDAVETVVADDPAPDRVVQVQHQALV